MIDLTMKTSVMAALRQGDMKRATELALEALKSGQQDALYLNLRAQLFEVHGRNREAMADLEAAHALAPRDTGVLEAMGLLRLRLGQPVGARAAFVRLIEVAPAYAHGYFCLGLAHEILGDLAAAEECFKRADAMEPGRSPTLVRIASLAARRADWDEARRYANDALTRNPQEFDAMLVLAGTDLAEGKTADVVERLRPIAADASIQPETRASAASAMGDALDEQGDTGAAFDAYTNAGSLFVQAYTPLFANRQSAFEQVSELRAEFEAAPANPIKVPAIAATQTNGETGHVFLMGFPRSGTTLLEAVLTAHPDVVSTEERDHVGDAASLLEGPEVIAKFGRMSEVEAGRFRRAYWESVASCGANVTGRVFLDKLPLNTIKLPVIYRLFPNAKIVFAVREPRDVVFSCFRRRMGVNPSMFELLTLEGAARYYGAVMNLFETYRTKLALNVTQVRYEDLVADLEREAQRVCAAMGIQFVPEMRNFAQSSRLSATPSGLQVKKGLYETGAGQWKKYEQHMSAVLPQLAPWVQRWGYDKTA